LSTREAALPPRPEGRGFRTGVTERPLVAVISLSAQNIDDTTYHLPEIARARIACPHRPPLSAIPFFPTPQPSSGSTIHHLLHTRVKIAAPPATSSPSLTRPLCVQPHITLPL
jgi:hypothetical protein